MSLVLQRENITVSTAVSKLQSVELSLRDMVQNPGPQLQQFDTDVNGNQYGGHTLQNVVDRAVLDQQKRAAVQAVRDCIQSRFENIQKDSIYFACNVFDHRNWSAFNDNENDLGKLTFTSSCLETLNV